MNSKINLFVSRDVLLYCESRGSEFFIYLNVYLWIYLFIELNMNKEFVIYVINVNYYKM